MHISGHMSIDVRINICIYDPKTLDFLKTDSDAYFWIYVYICTYKYMYI